MSNTFKILKLDILLQKQVNDCIRAHRYIQIDDMLAAIKNLGVDGIHRSSLHRYAQKLKAQDEILAAPDEGTIVTIVERSTGEVRVIKTRASALAVASLIAKINEPPNIS